MHERVAQSTRVMLKLALCRHVRLHASYRIVKHSLVFGTDAACATAMPAYRLILACVARRANLRFNDSN